ncbi:ComF family protein [Phocaeicola coprophilus]|nr:ComF family protein [Phocaeicola coprophilus]
MSSWIDTLLDLAFPRLCLMCGKRLAPGERHVCATCLGALPRTNFHLISDNLLEERFRGVIPVERTAALFFYQKGNPSCEIIHRLKYAGKPDIGVYFGALLAREAAPSGFFRDIDLLLPVPLSRKRMRRRGYNQAEQIACGVSQVTGIPLSADSLARLHDNPTQTRRNRQERLANTEGLFGVEHPDRLQGKHILLIDDVVTTGATLRACAEAVCACSDVRISLLALGCTAG